MMKIFNKIYNWFFDRETDKEEDWEVPPGTSRARKPESSKSQIKRHSEIMSKWQRDFLSDSFGATESDKQDDHTLKTKYYKRKVKVFHGLQGFKWRYFEVALNRSGYGGVIIVSPDSVEITKEEYEANVK